MPQTSRIPARLPFRYEMLLLSLQRGKQLDEADARLEMELHQRELRGDASGFIPPMARVGMERRARESSARAAFAKAREQAQSESPSRFSGHLGVIYPGARI